MRGPAGGYPGCAVIVLAKESTRKCLAGLHGSDLVEKSALQRHVTVTVIDGTRTLPVQTNFGGSDAVVCCATARDAWVIGGAPVWVIEPTNRAVLLPLGLTPGAG